MLTADRVHHIRTSGETDAHQARKHRRTVTTIRRARIGDTHQTHPTPPDRAPREGSGRYSSPRARPARLRRSYFG